MADDVDLSRLADRLRAAVADLHDLLPVVEAGAPWPVSERFGTEPEASWGPPETLAHVAEMLPFWIGEMERVLAGAVEPVPFGRVASDALRIGLIERDRTLPPRELFGRIQVAAERLAGRIGELDGGQASRRGSHPRLGELTVAVIVERFAAAHLEEHVVQLRQALRTPD